MQTMPCRTGFSSLLQTHMHCNITMKRDTPDDAREKECNECNENNMNICGVCDAHSPLPLDSSNLQCNEVMTQDLWHYTKHGTKSRMSRHQTAAMQLKIYLSNALPSAVKAPCLVVENMKLVPARILSPFTKPVLDRASPALALTGSGNDAAQ